MWRGSKRSAVGRSGSGNGRDGGRSGRGVGKPQRDTARRSFDPPQAINVGAFMRALCSSTGVTGTESDGDDGDRASSASSDTSDICEAIFADMFEQYTTVSSEPDEPVSRFRGRRPDTSPSSTAAAAPSPHVFELHISRTVAPAGGLGGSFGSMGASLGGGSSFHTVSTPSSPAIEPPAARSRTTAKKGKRRGTREHREDPAADMLQGPSKALLATRGAVHLRRLSSGRSPFVRSSSSDVHMHHARSEVLVERTCRKKRSRSVTKKAIPETHKESQMEIFERRRRDRFLIPRLARSVHFSMHLVLDLDETVISARHGPIIVRPGFATLVEAAHRLHCEVILWTAGAPQYVQAILDALTMAVSDVFTPTDRCPRWFDHLIMRCPRWYRDGHPCTKDLSLLGRPLDRVLILENNPASAQLQQAHCLLVQDYIVDNFADRSLYLAAEVIGRCARELQPVPETLATDPLLTNIAFDLDQEFRVPGVGVRLTERGLRYVAPGDEVPRTYAGETATAITDGPAPVLAPRGVRTPQSMSTPTTPKVDQNAS